MTDIVERLKIERSEMVGTGRSKDRRMSTERREAASEIERLRIMLDRLDQVVGAYLAGDCHVDLLNKTRQQACGVARAAQMDGEG